MNDVIAALNEAADVLQRATSAPTVEQCFFMVGGVAATLKLLAIDLGGEL